MRNEKKVVLRMKLKKISNFLMNCINPLLENLKREKCIRHLKTIYGCGFSRYTLISKPKKGFRLSLCVIDIFSKYA